MVDSVNNSPYKVGSRIHWECEVCHHVMETETEDDPDVTIITGPVKFWDNKKVLWMEIEIIS